jgi:hypothetical protein
LKRIKAYVLAADPTWVEFSVSAYYPYVQEIIVSYDRRGLGWTAEIAKLDKALSDPLLFTRDPAKAASVAKKRADAARKLATAEKAWIAASEAYENANA